MKIRDDKTKYQLMEKPYNLVDILPEVLRQLINKTEHSAHKITAVEASKSENETDRKKHKKRKYNN